MNDQGVVKRRSESVSGAAASQSDCIINVEEPNEKHCNETENIDDLRLGYFRSDELIRTTSNLSLIASICEPLTSSLRGSRSERYTFRQAFFIVAGGLAVETKSFHKDEYLVVTPAGAVELARLNLLGPISRYIIDDKAKAKSLTKGLTCLQGAWFVIQCLTRVVQDLPLTLLEVHVLSHVIIALLMYLCWFYKPYNVREPIIVDQGEGISIEIAALLSLNQKIPTSDGTKQSSNIKGRSECAQQTRGTGTKSANSLDERYDKHISLARSAIERLKSGGKHYVYLQGADGSIHQRDVLLTHPLADLEKQPGDLFKHVRTELKSRKSILHGLSSLSSRLQWFTVIVTLFGGFHLSAWNGQFPT